MESNENIYDKIKELLGSLPSKLNVLEEKIDIELQMEYFEQSRRERNKLTHNSCLDSSSRLFSDEVSNTEKKCILAGIASLPEIEAYRTIERFLTGNPGELRNWGILALQECRMLLGSLLLDENHVFISTGLGGKGHKLRYFIVLFGKEKKDFKEFQRKIIQNEFEICLKKYHSEMEELKFSGSIASMLVMIPMKVNIKNLFTEAIKDCNQFGDFLISNFIITNVKELSFDEIRTYVDHNQEYNSDTQSKSDKK